MIKFWWQKDSLEESLKTSVDVSNTDELYRVIKGQMPQNFEIEDLNIYFDGYNPSLKEITYAVKHENFGILGFMNNVFWNCEICKKDYLYERSNSKKFPHKCCSNVCEQEMLKKNKEFVDGLTFSYIELQNYQEKKRILFKINDLKMDYNLVLEKKGNKWIVEEDRRYIWHQMFQRENQKVNQPIPGHCTFCNHGGNHCADFLNDCIDEIFEKITKEPTVRMELLF